MIKAVENLVRSLQVGQELIVTFPDGDKFRYINYTNRGVCIPYPKIVWDEPKLHRLAEVTEE